MLQIHGHDHLVGSRLSRADFHLVELLFYVEERDPSLLSGQLSSAEGPENQNWQPPYREEVSIAWQSEETSPG